MINFRNDYSAGAHPAGLEALCATNMELPPGYGTDTYCQEAAEAIADYRELIFQEEREESRLVEELGTPVQAAHLLTDVKAYRRWLAVFAVLAFGLFLLVKWAWTGIVRLSLFDVHEAWFPVWVMAVGLLLSLYWFRRPNVQAAGTGFGSGTVIPPGICGAVLVCP